MAPGYRASGQSRRANRGQVDHDIFEGLPVRNWSREFATIAPPPAPEIASQKNKWDIELPWGMPKDFQLLPQHSQDLLRLARSGKLYQKRPAPDDDEVEAEPVVNEKPEKKIDDTKDKGYVVKTWKALPKNIDRPDVEYLAKRRKGLRGSALIPGAPPIPTVTKATVRKTDAEGNSYVEEIIMTEGQTIEGEVISSTVITDPSALPKPHVSIQRRGRIPKRKMKGPGRGRKKIVPVATEPAPGEPGEAKPEGKTAADGTAAAPVSADGIKTEDTPAGETKEGANGDTQMDDGDDDDGEEGEDGEDGDSGDEGEDGDDQDQDDEVGDDDTTTNLGGDTSLISHDDGKARDPSSSPERPLSSSRPPLRQDQGSPLKHSTSATDIRTAVYSPHDDEAEAEGDDDDVEEDEEVQPPPHAEAITGLPADTTYYQSHDVDANDSAMGEGVGHEYDEEDQEMLEFDEGLNPDGMEEIHDDQYHQQFGFEGHHLPQEGHLGEGNYVHSEGQFDMPPPDTGFVPGGVLHHDNTEGYSHLEGDIPVQQPVEDGKSGQPEEAQDSFEDLLGNEEIGGLDEEAGDDDLMAGLDKHLLESSGDPVTTSEPAPKSEAEAHPQPTRPVSEAIIADVVTTEELPQGESAQETISQQVDDLVTTEEPEAEAASAEVSEEVAEPKTEAPPSTAEVQPPAETSSAEVPEPAPVPAEEEQSTKQEEVIVSEPTPVEPEAVVEESKED